MPDPLANWNEPVNGNRFQAIWFQAIRESVAFQPAVKQPGVFVFIEMDHYRHQQFDPSAK